MVNEANAMSEEMDKKVKYELALISPQARGLKEGRTEVGMGFVFISHNSAYCPSLWHNRLDL
jgi:hypothetical protein